MDGWMLLTIMTPPIVWTSYLTKESVLFIQQCVSMEYSSNIPVSVSASSKSNNWIHLDTFGFRCKTRTEGVDRIHVMCKFRKSELKYCKIWQTSIWVDTEQKFWFLHLKWNLLFGSKHVSSNPLSQTSSVCAQKMTESVAVFICKDPLAMMAQENTGFKKTLHTLEHGGEGSPQSVEIRKKMVLTVLIAGWFNVGNCIVKNSHVFSAN